MIAAGFAAVCAAGWVARPFVVMRRHGTLDQQRLAAIREEARAVAARRAALGVAPVVPLPPLPRPRTAADAQSPTRATTA